VRRQGQGLKLLTHDGRPKFYHSRTCVAMTRQELFEPSGGLSSESEGDLREWQVGGVAAWQWCSPAQSPL
jgi:hypothetical protein